MEGARQAVLEGGRAGLPRGGEPPGAEEIIAFCQERLAKFKCPKDVRFLESLPKNAIGKIAKKDLKKQYLEGAFRGGR